MKYSLSQDDLKKANHYSGLAEIVLTIGLISTLQFSHETITQDGGFYALAILIPLYLVMCGSKIARAEQKDKSVRAAQLWNTAKFGLVATGVILALLGFEALRLNENDAVGDMHLKLGFGLIITAGLMSTLSAALKAGFRPSTDKINHNRVKAAVGAVMVAAFICLTFGDMIADPLQPLNFNYGQTDNWHKAGWGLVMFAGAFPIVSTLLKKADSDSGVKKPLLHN